MRERAARELNPEMGRMGGEDPSRVFRSAPLAPRKQAEDHQAEERTRGDDKATEKGPVARPRFA